ncbi:MAG TPA: VOC family protein, partial [Bryobacteraceae bacterium]|nr:VOC family protein [Bryobacteraceae bacterium]
TITPHLVIRGAAKAIEFYRKAFGAEVRGDHRGPDGKVMHAELKIGDSVFFLADEYPGMGSCASPETLGGSTVIPNLYAENIDQVFNQAVAAGATVLMPLADQFWGDRYGQLQDPFGHVWALGQHIEDLTREEQERRAREFFAKLASQKGSGH